MDNSFLTIPGQKVAKQILLDGLRSPRVPHAWLLTGAPGSGAEEAGLELAKAMVCQGKVPLPCNQCDACRRINTGNYLDFFLIEPQDKYLRIEQVRQLIKDMDIAPVESAGLRIFLIKGLERMQAVAQNALLKSLEEPWPQVRFILVAGSLQAVLPTVLSRCRHVPFFLYPRQEICRVLLAEAAPEPDILAALCGGNLRLAREIASGKSPYLQIRDVAINLLSMVTAETFLLTRFEKEAGKAKDQTSFLAMAMQTWMHDLLAVRLGASQRIVRNADLLPRLQTEAAAWHPGYLARGIQQVAKSFDRLQGNTNYKLEMTCLGLRLRELATIRG